MKNFAKQLFILITPFLFSCHAKKEIVVNSNQNITSNTETICPENGICTTKILKNKRLILKTDEFGYLYHETTEDLNTSVIHFEFNRKAPKGLQDGNYKEEILFQINNSDSGIALSDLDLQNTNMIFRRLCFCRGQTGSYKVTTGNLKLKQKENTIDFSLDFKISQVPQIISSIKTTIK